MRLLPSASLGLLAPPPEIAMRSPLTGARRGRAICRLTLLPTCRQHIPSPWPGRAVGTVSVLALHTHRANLPKKGDLALLHVVP